MIDDLDEALREILTRDMPINASEVDIAFETPTREWSSRLSRPTINCFMHDVRENTKLRTRQPYLGVSSSGMSASVNVNPIRLDIHYLITAWANDPADEHRLLGRLLMVLFRYQVLPEESLLGSLEDSEFDILVKVAQVDQREFRREIWSMLDNEMKPIIDLTLTIAIEPYAPWDVPLVRSTEISFGQMDPFGLNNGNGNNLNSSGIAIGDQFYSVSGTIHSDNPFEPLSVNLLEVAIPVILDAAGHYTIAGLRGGTYTLEVWDRQGAPTQHVLEVPSNPAEYDIYL
jgi:hypothetical protein